MAPAYKAETTFLRGCARSYASEIGFAPRAELEMVDLGVEWPDVHQVICGGQVIWSDKEVADCAKSIMVGPTCNGDVLRLTLEWDCASNRVLVCSVERL